MEDYTKYFKFIILIAIGVIVVVIINSKDKGFDSVISNMTKDEFYGIVVNKFIDGENHNQPTVKLSTGRTVLFYSYEYVEINKGDSLAKEKLTTILQIFKKDTVINIDRKTHLENLKNKNLK